MLPGSTQPVAHDHASDQGGRDKRFVVAAAAYASPWCVANAVGAQAAVAQQQRVYTQQPVIVQSLHGRDACVATRRMDRWRNLHPEVVDVGDVGLPLGTDLNDPLAPPCGPAAGPSEACETRSCRFVRGVFRPDLDTRPPQHFGFGADHQILAAGVAIPVMYLQNPHDSTRKACHWRNGNARAFEEDARCPVAAPGLATAPRPAP